MLKLVPVLDGRYLTQNMEQEVGSRGDEGRTRQKNRHCSVVLVFVYELCSLVCFYPVDAGVL